MRDLADLCCSPETGESLTWTADGALTASSGLTYPVQDGVASFLTGEGGDQEAAREFYESFGWIEDEEGLFGDTKAFLDLRAAPTAFTHQCMQRLTRHFTGGDILLDAGSGPIIYDEVMQYGARYGQRICLDLSARALRIARRKLGDRGLYLQADISRIPLKDDSVDAITCNHVIYQLPRELQAPAFRELYRVLKPGGVAVIVYWWETAKLAWRIERIARLLPMRGPGAPSGATLPTRPHNPMSRAWFEAQDWPFRYEYDIYRVVTNAFMRTYVSDDWRGKLALGAISALQALAPSYCGEHGVMPAIIIRK